MREGLLFKLPAIVHSMRAELVAILLCLFGKPVAVFLGLGSKI
jgi:hypothetical protein